MADTFPPIGLLRWAVNIYQRIQAPDTDVGITETDVSVFYCAASIEPIGRSIRYLGIAADADLFRATHFIVTEWHPYSDVTYEITRLLNTPDGQTRLETFTVLAVEEIGELQFTKYDCVLLTTVWTPGLPNAN